MEPDVNFPGNIIRTMREVPDARQCSEHCAQQQDCQAWSWGKDIRGKPWSRYCYLRGRMPKQVLSRIRDLDFVSAIVGRSVTTQIPKKGQSLFCFSLIIPSSYELNLMQLAYQKNTHIFNCDEYATYSNSVFLVAPGVETLPVNSDLKCESGGEFGTALNNDIFLEVWRVVIEGQRYAVHDWTVKVDPDCVFIPDRMRSIVAQHQEFAGGTYLNNCEFGLHGPLEVFSKWAVEAWKNGRQRCIAYFNMKCSGDCKWGEDMFIDQCLQHLRVYRVDEFNLLTEDHCKPPANWQTCTTGNKQTAAFHPFKDVGSYDQCLRNALA
jgi:hypothetical protein